MMAGGGPAFGARVSAGAGAVVGGAGSVVMPFCSRLTIFPFVAELPDPGLDVQRGDVEHQPVRNLARGQIRLPSRCRPASR